MRALKFIRNKFNTVLPVFPSPHICWWSVSVNSGEEAEMKWADYTSLSFFLSPTSIIPNNYNCLMNFVQQRLYFILRKICRGMQPRIAYVWKSQLMRTRIVIVNEISYIASLLEEEKSILDQFWNCNHTKWFSCSSLVEWTAMCYFLSNFKCWNYNVFY